LHLSIDYANKLQTLHIVVRNNCQQILINISIILSILFSSIHLPFLLMLVVVVLLLFYSYFFFWNFLYISYLSYLSDWKVMGFQLCPSLWFVDNTSNLLLQFQKGYISFKCICCATHIHRNIYVVVNRIVSKDMTIYTYKKGIVIWIQ